MDGLFVPHLKHSLWNLWPCTGVGASSAEYTLFIHLGHLVPPPYDIVAQA